MAQILDFLRAAIAPANQAVEGIEQGEELKRERTRQAAIQDAAMKRNSILDQLRASVDASTIRRNNANADRAERTPAPKPAPPHTLKTDKGILQWNPDTNQYESTGLNAPAPKATPDPVETHRRNRLFNIDHPLPETPASARAAANTDRTNAKTALDEALKALPRPSKVPANVLGTDAKGRSTMTPNPARAKAVADSNAYEATTLSPLRRALSDATKPRGTASTGAPAAAAAPPTSSTGGGTGGNVGATVTSVQRTRLNDRGRTSMQAEFDDASADLQAVLSSSAPKAVKDRARALYNQHQAEIAKKYSVTASGTPTGASSATGATGAATPPDDEDDEDDGY